MSDIEQKFNLTTESKTYTSTGANSSFEENLGVFALSLAVTNRAANSVKVYVNKYTEDVVEILPNTYKEIAITTNWYRVEFSSSSSSSDYVVVDVVKVANVGKVLAPLFPNLIQTASNNEEILYNPINAGGFAYTPWTISGPGSENKLYGSENIVKIEYYLNGQSVASDSTNFYTDFFNLLMGQVQALYPAGYVSPVNPDYDPATLSEVTAQLRQFFDSRDIPLNDEFLGGWASLTDFNRELSLAKFSLSASGPNKIAFPFSVLGFTVTNPDPTNAQIEYKTDDGTTSTLTIPANNSVTIVDINLKELRVITGRADLTFSGHLVRMIAFAPIVNVVYPIGFDESSGKPADQYNSFVNSLNAFRSTLAQHKFTGRVIYFKAVPFEAQPYEVWNADYIIPNFTAMRFDLVWQEVQHLVANPFAKSKVEDDLLKIITWENRNYYFNTTNPPALPKDVDEVLTNPNVTKFLGNDLSPLSGAALTDKKVEVLKEWLLREYLSPYSLGGINFSYGHLN